VSRSVLLATFVAVLVVGATPFLLRRLSRRLRSGDRLRLGEGYELPPPWLGGLPHASGTVHSIISNRAGRGCIVVRLDEPVIPDARIPGPFHPWKPMTWAVLSLHYPGARWSGSEIVNVALAGSPPEGPADIEAATVVESHGRYWRWS
jgi:hypothetical protein